MTLLLVLQCHVKAVLARSSLLLLYASSEPRRGVKTDGGARPEMGKESAFGPFFRGLEGRPGRSTPRPYFRARAPAQRGKMPATVATSGSGAAGAAIPEPAGSTSVSLSSRG